MVMRSSMWGSNPKCFSECVGEMRSYHIEGSTVAQVTPIVASNVAREARIMTDAAALYKRMNQQSYYASHDRIDHSKHQYARYEEGKAIQTNTVAGYFIVFKRGMRNTYQHCKERHLHRYLSASISATTTASH